MSDKKEVVAKENKKAKDNSKPGFFKKMGIGLKNMGKELKKVSWPTFPKVVKQTGVVLGVVLVFLVVITAFDGALQLVMRLITKS